MKILLFFIGFILLFIEFWIGVFFIFISLFLRKKEYKERAGQNIGSHSDNNESPQQTLILRKSNQEVNKLELYFNIPEPTKSLLYVTDDNLEKKRYKNSIHVSFTENGLKDKNENIVFYSEPSLVWTKLEILENNNLYKNPMYYPDYSDFSPEQRYQYLKWLEDIKKPTNLSYVFLYYYGLEREMITGDFEKAFNEILKLMKYHDRGTFLKYSLNSIIVASIYFKKIHLLKKINIKEITNETLLVKKFLNQKITANDIIKISSKVGFKNKRYMKLYPKKFLNKLEKEIKSFEMEQNRDILGIIDFQELKKKKEVVFANPTIDHQLVPQLIDNKKFKKILFELLKNTHESIKKDKFYQKK